ncbi:MAG TPA: GDSL-type esterase/lipase family protein [Pseudonocardiaceae bacterium]|nr:GDSL-type esterase/lipase family protein [Pseudonocardiaceae bacterium]
MRSPNPRLKWTVLVAVLLLAAFALVTDVPTIAPAPVKHIGPPANAPLTLVTMGDSTISGEGAGDYTATTNGANGDWCHRSTHAEVDQTSVPGVTRTINLACSGADSPAIGLGRTTHYTEPSQAAQLAPIAAHDRIVAIVLAGGANDDPHFSQLVDTCIQAYFTRNVLGCSGGFTPQWQQRVNAMIPKVEHVLSDIRTVMTHAGYAPGSYQLVLQSYAAPIGPDISQGLQSLAGCPFETVDLKWVRNTGIHVLDNGLATAARTVGVRFLDLSGAGIGHEACSGGPKATNEWFTRLTVAWQDLDNSQRAGHALQSSFHPNAAGYAAFGSCLSAFLATTDPSAACLPGPNGTLHPAPTVLSPH